MYTIINTPNLPNSRVSELLIGNDYVNLMEKALHSHNIDIMALPVNTEVSPPLRSHADLMAAHICGDKIVLTRSLEGSLLVNLLTNRGMRVIFSQSALGETYPSDIGLCAALVGARLFHNLKYTDSAITGNIESDISLIHINQGYAKCSICVVDENSIITSDRGAGVAASDSGLDVLIIEDIEIALSGYDNGFIGGASFKIAPDKLAFTGHFKNKETRERIEGFLFGRGISAVYLTELPIFDIGGAVPLFEA